MGQVQPGGRGGSGPARGEEGGSGPTGGEGWVRFSWGGGVGQVQPGRRGGSVGGGVGQPGGEGWVSRGGVSKDRTT